MPINRRALGTALFRIAVPLVTTAAPAARRVTVLAATDRIAVQPLIDGFQHRYPDYQVDYRESGTVEMYEHFLAVDGKGADVLWSSAMDLQMKLVNDGYAMRYESPHAPSLPRWAVWKHEAYGATYEPVGIAYRRQQLAPTRFRERMRRWRRCCAPTRSAFTGASSPTTLNVPALVPDRGSRCNGHTYSWELVRALGACQAGLYPERRACSRPCPPAGRCGLQRAGHLCGSLCTAQPRSRRALPSDYTLVMSRVAFIARDAPNPQGARLWLDHLLSQEGQRLLAERGGLV